MLSTSKTIAILAASISLSAQAQSFMISSDPNSVLPSMEAYHPNGEPNYRYQGLSGELYQYDLSRPLDRMQYNADPQARMHDFLYGTTPNQSVDEYFSQQGGGANPLLPPLLPPLTIGR